MDSASSSTLKRRLQAGWIAGAFLGIVALAQGFFAAHLNRLYYTTHAPFFDSMAYDIYLAQVLTAARDHGVLEGFHTALYCSTVALPYLTVVPAAPWTAVSRATGVWLQVPWIFALLASSYSLFRIRFRASSWMAVFLALPFTFISAVYKINGGLSDFRMDLNHYLLFGCAICWFVIALQTQRIAHWLVCGVFIGLAALARATSPIFLALTMGAILAPRLAFHSGDRWKSLRGILLAAIFAALLAGWFFALRFHDLYNYYVVWNPDANAHFPLSKSSAHFVYALNSVGRWIVFASIAAVAVTIPWKSVSMNWLKERASLLPWEFVVAAFVPAAFLTIRGAGLNEFVAMPSAFGIVALILGTLGDWSGVGAARGALAAALLVLGCGIDAGIGLQEHALQQGYKVAGIEIALDAVERDARQQAIAAAQISGISVGDFSTQSIQNVLIFNRGYSHFVDASASDGKLTLDADKSRLFAGVTYGEWLTIPGGNDTERVDHLVRTANSSIDYIFVPSEATVVKLETRRSQNYINRYSRWIKREILANPAWQPVSGEIAMTSSEAYTVYANRSRQGASKASP